MKCSHIKKILSQYLDGELGEKENELMSEHLRSCSKCSIELDLLKETVSLLKAKEPVQPPQDFVVQVRKKIESRRWWREFIRLIFIPWHIKIPAEAIATILIVCLLYYVYKDEVPSRRVIVIREKPAEVKEVSETRREKEEKIKAKALVPQIDLEEEAFDTGIESLYMEDEKKLPVADKIEGEVAPGGIEQIEEKEYIKPPPQELAAKIARRKRYAVRAEKVYRLAESATWQEIDTEGYITPSEARLEAPLAEEELILTLKKPGKDLLRIRKYLELLHAKDIEDIFDKKTKETIISFQVSRKNYSELIKKLTQMEVLEPHEIKKIIPEIVKVRLRIR